MAVVFIASPERVDAWRSELLRLCPDLDLRIWPDIGDEREIEYALVACPQPGVLGQLPNLKAIFSTWAGVETLLQDPTLPDLPLVRMVEPSLTRGMVEYVCCHVLNAHLRSREYGGRDWQHGQHDNPRTAADRSVGILGMGELGTACAQALDALGFSVAGWSRRAKSVAGVESFHGDTGFAACLARSEIVVCLLPLTPATKNIFDRHAFAAMPRGATLINAARGEHIVDADLLAALADGRLAGAVLDAFRIEPLPPEHPFWSHPKVTVTPHVASVTIPSTAVPVILDNMARFERGALLAGLVDRTRGY